MNTMQSAMETISQLWSLMLEKQLAENILSPSVADKILSPMRYMSWDKRQQKAEQLIEIIQTSKTEQEILQRATSLK